MASGADLVTHRLQRKGSSISSEKTSQPLVCYYRKISSDPQKETTFGPRIEKLKCRCLECVLGLTLYDLLILLPVNTAMLSRNAFPVTERLKTHDGDLQANDVCPRQWS